MKRTVLTFLLVLTMVVNCTAVLADYSLSGNQVVYDTPNIYEQMYNISYYMDASYFNDDIEGKITSYQELANQFPDCQEILSKYDEAFFENKFLYRIGISAGDGSWKIRVSNVANTQESVDIELTLLKKVGDYPQMVVPWDILFEFGNTTSDKTITVAKKLSNMGDYAKISYCKSIRGNWQYSDDYDNGIKDPKRCKIINSSKALAEYLKSESRLPTEDNFNTLVASYDESFFEDKFLLFYNHTFGRGSNIVFDLYDISEKNDMIEINLEEIDMAAGGIAADVVVDWLVIFELDSSLLSKGYSIKLQHSRGKVMEVISGVPSDPIATAAAYSNAFAQEDATLVEISLGEDNGKKTAMVGNKELFYNSEKGVYSGLVPSSKVDGDKKLTGVSVIASAPTTFTYGNLVANSRDEANISDLHAMKLIIEKNILPDEHFLIASDLNGDGQCNISDLQAMKQYIEMGIDFPVLN